jgi:hypothetical protein
VEEMNESKSTSDIGTKEIIPLADLFTEMREGPSKVIVSKKEKLARFISKCKKTSGTDMSESECVNAIVKNALIVEFGTDVVDNTDMLTSITEALLSETVLKQEALDFADRHMSKIDKALIN